MGFQPMKKRSMGFQPIWSLDPDMQWFGLINVLSLIYLTFVVAMVIGLHEVEDETKSKRHVLGCWAKLLGSMVGLMLIIYIFSLFAG